MDVRHVRVSRVYTGNILNHFVHIYVREHMHLLRQGHEKRHGLQLREEVFKGRLLERQEGVLGHREPLGEEIGLP